MCLISLEGQIGFPRVYQGSRKAFLTLTFFVFWHKVSKAYRCLAVILRHVIISVLSWMTYLIPGIKLYKKQDYALNIRVCVCVSFCHSRADCL